MNIIVYDIAASGGGGTTILKQYIDEGKKDVKNNWWFIVSLPELQDDEAQNVHILYQSKLNKRGMRRWVERFIFEHTKLIKIVSEIKPDRVLSLQNMTMPRVKCPQTVYLHQSIQFAPVRFSFFKKEERACAIRQRIICPIIRRNLCKADDLIVQTPWMKKATVQWTGISETKIKVRTPRVPEISGNKSDSLFRKANRFFYPAGGDVYKNHKIIIEACKLLKHDGIEDYHVEFTLNPTDNELTKYLHSEIQREGLPVSFAGYLSRDEVYKKYTEQTLLFPSYIETYGLPLQEAKTFGAPIIVSDCAFSHDVLEGYKQCQYICWNDASQWAQAMRISMGK